MTHIKNHILADAIDVPSPNRGGIINPKFVVMHYTAGFSARSAVNTLTRRGSGVSAHLTIDLNGTAYQHVPFNIRAWHAGPSQHMGYSGLNGHSVGIEIVNAGWFRKNSNGDYVRDNIVRRPDQMPLMIEAENPRVGSGMLYWPQYTNAQLEAVEDITQALADKYNILDVVTHEEIDTRGWKTDPGPAFPMNRYKKLLGGRDQDADRYAVTANSLNVRGGPGGRYAKVAAALPRGTVVAAMGQSGSWVRISQDGWVHSGYLRRV